MKSKKGKIKEIVGAIEFDYGIDQAKRCMMFMGESLGKLSRDELLYALYYQAKTTGRR